MSANPAAPSPVDYLVRARWIVPVEPEGAVLEDHAVAVGAGRIVAVEPWSALRPRHPEAAVIERPRHVLIPGLVNAHTHAAMTLLRGLADDLPLMTWLQEHIWPAEARWVGEAFVHDGTLHAVAEMLRGGVTCFNDMYFFPEVTARVAAEAGLRAVVGLIVIDFPSAWARNADEYLAKGLELHDAWRNHPLIRTALAPHAPYTVADAALERVRVLADELEIPVHIHVHETAEEVARAVAETGERPLARLDRLGLVSPALLAVHATQLTPAEIARLADAGAHVVHCPESNLKLASGFCPVQALAEAGVGLALGTDGAASNNDLDLLGEMRTAALLAKAVAGRADALPAARVLAAATLGGARALGLEAEIGSLVPGKAADLVAVDLGAPETQPVYDVISQLVYAAGREQVTDVWVAGRPLLRDRVLLTVDEEAILVRSAQWARRIAAPPGEAAP
ncbi:TRZ/ATZ family hydrolase [Inmirania thermothiophila]|uniref:5-methylthioadenosine/S-adenosylhomocysteine deaminase n=1 Tax=Inmirania thermothiophila TaxID=1750597 RepID=A0A3N1Y4S4_9GAMM|nr:TRZ/ATZ family hydrolase [Inmirania thermothiophila]ROR32287.1 5-methylthioadenosine/S-adenosylhomocysteine deaminase [Inmirania thermothiophila]